LANPLPPAAKTIAIVAPPAVTLQDLTGPWEVFCRAALYSPGTYRVVVASCDEHTQVATKFGLGISCHCSVFELNGALDTVLVAGSDQGLCRPLADEAFLEWLRAVPRRCRRVGSICTGAFYLAQAGLLRGRRATTHWRYLGRLAEEFPDVQVEADPIFVRDGAVWTSAGITAGIDLALALVEEDCGKEIANTIARDLVMFLQRQADQSQLSATLAHRMADRQPIRRLQAWVADHLHEIANVSDMAGLANMSPRNFSRLFKRETGVSPGHYLRSLRAEAARRRVQDSGAKQDAVASQLGFGSLRSMQRSLQVGLRPSPARKKSIRRR
jgi:transcriptional regulator GlxA family with amidase domain